MLTSIGDPNFVWLTSGRQTTNIFEKYKSIFKILCLRSVSGEEIQQNFGRRSLENFCGFHRRDERSHVSSDEPCLRWEEGIILHLLLSSEFSDGDAGAYSILSVLLTFLYRKSRLELMRFQGDANERFQNFSILCIHTLAFIAQPKGYLV